MKKYLGIGKLKFSSWYAISIMLYNRMAIVYYYTKKSIGH